MTWWSTSCRKLREAKQKGGVPNAPAVIRPNSVNGGFTWFFDAASKLKPKSVKQSSNVDVGDPEQDADATEDTPDADQELNDIILKTPQVSGAALVNAMKAKGLKVVKVTEAWRARVDMFRPMREKSAIQQACERVMGRGLKVTKAKEADAASAFPQVTRETKFNFRPTNLRESASDDGIGPTKFKVVLLQEGLGNFGDAYYYNREALESAIPVFTGAKVYADHPSSAEEETRPERSVRDVLGHFENIQVETDKDDRAMLTGEVCILPDKPYEWARGLMRHAVDHAKKFPDKDFIGLSINASGDSSETPIDDVMKQAPSGAKPKLVEAKEQGIDTVRVVSKIKSAVSCDLVTEAGAGGKILNLIEGSKGHGS